MTHNTADCKSTDKGQGIIGQKAAALLECAENNGDDDGCSVLQFNGKKYSISRLNSAKLTYLPEKKMFWLTDILLDIQPKY